MNEIGRQLLAALDKGIDPLHGIPHPSSETIRAVAKASGFEIPSEARAALAELQKRWDAANNGVISHCYDKVREAYQKHVQATGEAVATLTPGKLEKHEVRDRESFEHEYRVKQSHFKEAQKKISSETIELVKPLVDSFSEKALAFADRLEGEEAIVADELHIAYQPSNTILAVRKAVAVVVGHFRTISPASGIRPTSIAAFVDDSK